MESITPATERLYGVVDDEVHFVASSKKTYNRAKAIDMSIRKRQISAT